MSEGVGDVTGWLTAATVGELIEHVWPDGADLPAAVLDVFLEAARDECAAYAPKLAEDDEVPARYRLAQLMQARSDYNAGGAPIGDGDMEGAGYGATTFPLDWNVRQLLRPQTGIGPVL